MGNSPSFGLGVHDTYSSRDVRMRDPEKEVERSTASRAPTHNEYIELLASQKPHSMPKFIRVTPPRPRPFSEFFFASF